MTNPGRIRDAFKKYRSEEFSEYRLPRYNVAPTQMVLGARAVAADRIEAIPWGTTGRINARAETIARAQTLLRCLIFADGFYEWKAGKPVYFTLKDGAPFAFAGLWEPLDGSQVTCTIITCPANDVVGAVHNRMPVILPLEAHDTWLAPEEPSLEVRGALLRPYDDAAMQSRPVSTRLNNARYDAPDILVHEDPVQTSLFTV